MTGPWEAFVDGDGDADCFESFDEAETWARELIVSPPFRAKPPSRIIITWELNEVANVRLDALGRIWTDLTDSPDVPGPVRAEIQNVAAVQPEIRFVP
jgi:hypothetical protein